MTSIFKSNKFFRIIKHFVLCIPLMFVLGTSIYTIVNPNAKDSYYGDTINDYDVFYDNGSNIQTNIEYTFVNIPYSVGSSTGFYNYTFITQDFTYSDYSVNAIVFYMNNNGGTEFQLFYDGVRVGTSNKNDFNGVSFIVKRLQPYSNGNSNWLDTYNGFEYFVYHDYSFLNNSFTYGMYQFNQVGFNKVDFIGLFDGIFTDNIHNVYTDFINSYLNYYLMIEGVYFAPWVIHMFIHFAYDLGDYFTSSFRRNKEDD